MSTEIQNRELAPGAILGSVQLLTIVGEGGMGRVWAARTAGQKGERLLAVKTALGAMAQDAEFERLLADEAKLASMISDPHVCGVYEMRKSDGHLYLVMEWSDGVTLRELLDASPEKKLPIPVVLKILIDVAHGLHAAHELRGHDGELLQVVHRDVSPQNVLLSTNGVSKLSDFGVAKAQGQVHRPTETGEVKGKLSYMSPEQVKTKQVDRRADLFAFGCLLYEACLGRRAFAGDVPLKTLYLILESEPSSPCSVDAEFPPELEKIILRCLKKDVESRYQDALDIASDLERFAMRHRLSLRESEVSAALQQYVGQAIAKKAKKIKDAIESLDSPQPKQVAPLVASGDLNHSELSEPVKRSKNTLWLGSLGAAAILGAIIFYTSRDRENIQTVSAVQAKDESSLSDSKRIKITISAIPSDAKIEFLGQSYLGKAEIEHLLESGKTAMIQVSRDGYRSEQKLLTLDESQSVALVLQAETKIENTPPSDNEAKNHAAKGSKDNNTAKSPGIASAVNTVMPVTQPIKKARSIDEENPF